MPLLDHISETTALVVAMICSAIAIYVFRIFNPGRRGIEMLTVLIAAVTAAVMVLQWRTLEKTDETMRTQQRAWIEPGPPGILGITDDRIHLLIRYRNIGGEPAVDAVIQLDNPLLVVDQPRDGNWYEALKGRNPVCRVAAPNSDGIVVYKTSAPDEFKAHIYPNQVIKNAAEVYAKTKVLVVEGCMGYRTVEKPRYAAFCYYMTPLAGKPPQEWGFTQCQTRNEAF